MLVGENSQVVESKIVPMSNICDIKKHISSDEKVKKARLLLCDIDDVLLKSGYEKETGHLGGLKWRAFFKKCIEELKNELKDPHLFAHITLFLAKSVPVTAVQNDTAELLKEFQDKYGCTVMGFTSRGSNGEKAWYSLKIDGVDKMTEAQLKAAGIDLSSKCELKSHEKIYKNSIIFAQNSSKGELLTELFKKGVFISEDYSDIIFIDDSDTHVKSVKEAMEKAAPRTNFIGVHYTAIQEAEAKEGEEGFDPIISTLQLVNLCVHGKFMKKDDPLFLGALELYQYSDPINVCKETIKSLDKIFSEDEELKKSFSTTDVFLEKVRKVFSEKFKDK